MNKQIPPEIEFNTDGSVADKTMPHHFCKLFEYFDIGQVLLMKKAIRKQKDDTSITVPVIKMTVNHEGTIFSANIQFEASEEGYIERDKFFEKLTVENTYHKALETYETLLTIKFPEGVPNG